MGPPQRFVTLPVPSATLGIEHTIPMKTNHQAPQTNTNGSASHAAAESCSKSARESDASALGLTSVPLPDHVSGPYMIPQREGIEVYPNEDDQIIVRSIGRGFADDEEQFVMLEVEDVERVVGYLRGVAEAISVRR